MQAVLFHFPDEQVNPVSKSSKRLIITIENPGYGEEIQILELNTLDTGKTILIKFNLQSKVNFQKLTCFKECDY